MLARGTPADNEWAGIRAIGRVKRNEYTLTLKEHGVEGYGFANCTNATYTYILDGNATKVKQSRGLAKNDNLRDHLSTDELVMVMAVETLAKGRIKEENSLGNRECEVATARSASFIRQALEADKKDRQRRLG